MTLSLAGRLSDMAENLKKNDDIQVFAQASAVEKQDKIEVAQSTKNNAAPRVFDQDKLSEENQIQQDRGLPDFPVLSFSETEIEVLQSLSKRRQALETRESALIQREALLKAAEQEVDLKIKELASLRKQLETLLDQQDEVQEGRIRRMVKIYESMKPKEAAAIFNSLDMEILLSVLSRMSERKSAPIFATMDPRRAQEITIRLVEQGQLPNLPDP